MNNLNNYINEVRAWDYSSLLNSLQTETDSEFLEAVKQVWAERGYSPL